MHRPFPTAPTVLVTAILCLLALAPPASAVTCSGEQPFQAGVGAFDLLPFFLPAPENRGKVIEVSNGERFQTVRVADDSGRFTERMHLIKDPRGDNFEVYAYDNNYIYHLRDTSWAASQAGGFLPVKCQPGNTEEAHFTLLNANPAASDPYNPCTISNLSSLLATNEGGRWVPRYMARDDEFTDCRTIVSINEQTCQCCNTDYDQVNARVAYTLRERTFESYPLNGGGTFNVEVIKLEVTAGPGAGDFFVYGKGWGLIGFFNPDGLSNLPVAIHDGYQAARQPRCRPAGCTDDCTECILTQRPDVIDFYEQNAGDSRPQTCVADLDLGGGLNTQVINDWCSWNGECNGLQTGTCAASCACEADCGAWALQADPDFCGGNNRWLRSCQEGDFGFSQQVCAPTHPGNCNNPHGLVDAGCKVVCDPWYLQATSGSCGATDRWVRLCHDPANTIGIWESTCYATGPPDDCSAAPIANAGMETNGSGQFGSIDYWGPNGGWAYHSQFQAPNNGSLGSRFGFYSAGVSESVGQPLHVRFRANRTYTFRSWAIGGGNRQGTVAYQIGYVAADGSFVHLRTATVNLDGASSWAPTAGVSWSTGGSGTEIGERVFVRFAGQSAGGASDIWFDNAELVVTSP